MTQPCLNHKLVQHRDGKGPWCPNCKTSTMPFTPHVPFPSYRPEQVADYPLEAKIHVVNYFNLHSEKTDDFVLSVDKVYVVWFAKSLQNWKALLSTSVPDGMYYEVTYNGDKRETYIDAYKKLQNVCIADGAFLTENEFDILPTSQSPSIVRAMIRETKREVEVLEYTGDNVVEVSEFVGDLEVTVNRTTRAISWIKGGRTTAGSPGSYLVRFPDGAITLISPNFYLKNLELI